ncbi:hypothetical protein HID58_047052 [Brassica napus]|uniref:Uncharacterized protein n=2 Tax=Brassica napus TaxID=3708 RepID=A0ABQ8AY98_BRANA|nr:hypothetical protein HID58_047052 [Brassica napus]CDY28581.1 BnaC02g19500D [Brassica napus]
MYDCLINIFTFKKKFTFLSLFHRNANWEVSHNNKQVLLRTTELNKALDAFGLNKKDYENGEEEFWSRFYWEREDLRVFSINQIDLYNTEFINQFVDRLNRANWNRRIDRGYEIARLRMSRLVRNFASTQIVGSIFELEKRVNNLISNPLLRIKHVTFQRGSLKLLSRGLMAQAGVVLKTHDTRRLPLCGRLSSSPDLVFPPTPPLEAEIEAEEKKNETHKRRAEWILKENEKFEAEKIVRAAEKRMLKIKLGMPQRKL